MEKRKNSISWLLNEQYRFLLHILFWIYIYLSDFLAIFGILEPGIYDSIFFSILALDIFIVYLNLYFLIPKFLLKRKYLSYLFLTLFTVLVNSYFSFYITYPWEEMGDPELEIPSISFIFGSFEATLSMVILAMTIKLLKIFAKNQMQITNLENTNLKTELTFLKNQINPHFLFNALNNIYVQTRKRPKEAPESVLLLSELLRYQLYDCSKDKVYLKNELEYLNNFLELERMRRTDSQIKITVNGSPNGKLIAPFLFMPFIENAIKHGIDTQKKGAVAIAFNIKEDSLDFKVINDKAENRTAEKVGGIGLINVKRRLQLLYPNQHELNIRENEQRYEVTLHLQF